MKNSAFFWGVLSLLFTLCSPSLSPHYNQLSMFLRTVIMTHSESFGIVTVGIFIAQNVTDDITGLISDLHKDKTVPLKILSKAPGNTSMSTFTDTIIFWDVFSRNVMNDTLETMFAIPSLWQRDSRYVFVIFDDFGSDVKNLSTLVTTPWELTRVLNYVVVYVHERLPKILIATYNPFNKTISNFTEESKELYPNKLRNLHGYSINISFTSYPPYIMEIDGKMRGQNYEFFKSLTKSINASMKELQRNTMDDMGEDLMKNQADMGGLSLFLYEMLLNSIGYPHGFMNIVVAMPKPQTKTLTNLFHIFDLKTWILTIVFAIFYRGLISLRSSIFKLFTVKPDVSLRITIFAGAILNIILSQTFQSWITTFLIYPEPVHVIDTVDELIESKLPVYTYGTWRTFVIERLKDQYVFVEDVVPVMKPGPGNMLPPIALTSDVFWSNSKRNNRTRWINSRPMKEKIGTVLVAFWMGRNAPYKNLLREMIVKSLAYGFTSKTWGIYTSSDGEEVHTAQTLQLKHLAGVFLILHAGMSISLVVFVVEHIRFSYKKRLSTPKK